MPRRLVFEDVKFFIEKLNFKLDQDFYKNNSDKLKIICDIGHLFLRGFGEFKTRNNCPVCYRENTNKNFLDLAKKENFIFDKYESCSKSLNYICPNGHNGSVKPRDFCAGTRCKQCRRDIGYKIIPLDGILPFIENKGLKYIEGYNGSLSKVTMECKNGHIFSARVSDLRSSKLNGCKKCVHEYLRNSPKKIVEEFGNKNFKVVDINQYITTGKNIDVLCPKGHETKMTLDRLRNGGRCSVCNFKQEWETRNIFEKVLSRKFPKKRKVFKENRKMELDGYCEELKLAFEYDGIQHSMPVYGSTKEIRELNFEKQKERDKIKNELCSKYGILLIRIPHTVGLNELENFIIKKLGKNGL